MSETQEAPKKKIVVKPSKRDWSFWIAGFVLGVVFLIAVAFLA